ncbi:MAG: amidase [Gammaproteobacteria bacterium]|nr:amidase [Gammaproteobacteria bacterium]
MKLNDYIQYDGTGLAELIQNDEVSEDEVLSCALQAAELLNPEINTILEVFAEPLQGSAIKDSAFQGVPFLIKDLALHAEGVLYEMGSRLTQGLRTPHDTDLMQRFRQAGLRTIGRCSTPEFGYCPTTEPVANGPSRNPWNLEHIPGGSSGATASSVAAGIVPLAHANDGGGSIRIPASCCGLLGLKPTRGRVPNGPDIAEPLSGLAIEFAVTRTVRDAARLLDAVEGAGIGDPFEIGSPAEPYSKIFEQEPGKLKIAHMTDAWSDAPVDPEVKQATVDTAKACEALGHHVIEARPEIDWDQFFAATHTLWTANIAPLVDFAASMSGRKPDETTLEATTLACYRYGKQVKAEELLNAQMTANAICRTVGHFFQDYDLLLTPTVAQAPLKIGEMNANDANLDALGWSTQVFNYCPFTPLFNTTGQPAVSLPLRQSAYGLPIGMQFVGRYGNESTLLQLARQFELSSPWPQIAPLINRHLEGE